MHSRRLFLCHIIWTICIIFTNIQPNACDNYSFRWMLDNTNANMVCANAAIGNAHVHSVIKCREICSRTPNCTAFTFAKSMSPNNCFLMNGVPLQQTGCTLSPDIKQYVWEEEVFSCHANDNMYHTIMLSGGDSFSYRVTQIMKTAVDAQSDCVSSGGSLAKVTTLARLELIRQLTQFPGFETIGYFWVDGSNANATDHTTSDAWKFNDGTQVNMTTGVFWWAGYPNDADTDHCMVVDRAKSMTFNDKNVAILTPIFVKKHRSMSVSFEFVT